MQVVVERWKRYGRDRGYVKVDGDQVGYRDLVSGTVVCDDPTHQAVIREATDHLVAAGAAAPPPVSPQPSEDSTSAIEASSPVMPPAPVTPSLAPDRDLALNTPGMAARLQAVALRDAAPVKTFFTRIAGLKTEERSWRIGADGEVEVGRRLARLDARWQTLHAIPIGDKDSDIDHLVIGPAGVFTLNTKHHPDANVWVRGDTFKVNGQNQHYIRNSRHEADRASRLLSARVGAVVPVNGLVIVMGATGGFVIKEQPADGRVTVILRRQVAKHLRSLPEVLDEDGIARIYEAARHLATWQPKTVGWSEL